MIEELLHREEEQEQQHHDHNQHQNGIDVEEIDYQKLLAELPPEYSEGEISERFTKQYADVVKYVEQWNCWMHWTGQKWEKLDAYAFEFARKTVREAACQLKAQQKTKAALIVYSNRFVAGVLGLARKNIQHFTRPEQFDGDDWLLNTPRGIVDLHTGKLLPHDPKYMMAKITSVAPNFEMATPIWENFLKETLEDDPVVIDFLQRLAGYCLTGVTSEEVLAFIYGVERTGKTTFVETISRLMGNYATMAVIESLTHRKNTMGDRHSTDIAKLRGARLARAAETEDGRTWTAAKIKELTGGDTITARLMRQDNEDFVPKCKLVIHGNYKPKLKNPEGIRRRLLLIDFKHQISADKQNKNLKEDLQAECPGILAWMIQGCLDWQNVGLSAPQKVLDATHEYFDEQEVVKEWLEDCCDLTDNKADWTKSQSLYKNYKHWSEANGEKDEVLSQRAFSLRLEALGVKKRKMRQSKAFVAIKLKIEAVDDEIV